MNSSGMIDDDVFDENSTNEELHLADNEFKRQLNSIKTVLASLGMFNPWPLLMAH